MPRKSKVDPVEVHIGNYPTDEELVAHMQESHAMSYDLYRRGGKLRALHRADHGVLYNERGRRHE